MNRTTVRPNVTLRGAINIDDRTSVSTGWMNTDPAKQPANRMNQLDVIVEGTGSAAMASWTAAQTNCDCLELRSVSPSAATSIVLSGTAATLLFGAMPDFRHSTDAPNRAAAYSEFAITSDVATGVSLAARLGNLTAAAGNSNRQFYISTPYAERANIRKPAAEDVVYNTSTTATIPRGYAVAAGTLTAETFVGIALEDIQPGKTGRVLKPIKGVQISQSHLGLVSATPSLGAILYIPRLRAR